MKQFFLPLLFVFLGSGLILSDVFGAGEHHEKSTAEGTESPVSADVMAGKMIYSMSCVFCHGNHGKGDGAASFYLGPYSHPRPNDFTRGIFKFRSTESGEYPTLSDLMRTIREGIPGFMPSFRNMGENKIRQVALFIAEVFIGDELPKETSIKYVEHAGPYTYSVESVKRGKKLYQELKCYECHGRDGKGADVNFTDERGLSIIPVDLTLRETFGNGTSHEDIYRTIMTGLDGTPMPSYSHLFSGREDQAWDLVHYILSLGEK